MANKSSNQQSSSKEQDIPVYNNTIFLRNGQIHETIQEEHYRQPMSRFRHNLQNFEKKFQTVDDMEVSRYSAMNFMYRRETCATRQKILTVGESYVETVRKNFERNEKQRKKDRRHEKLGSSPMHLKMRLFKFACDMGTYTCLHEMCGRSFESLRVLAFHLSYSHQDLTKHDSAGLTCLMCGKRWNDVNSKILHLSAKHRLIGEEHNSQCVVQVDPVIAPDAPKALRLARAREMYDIEIQEAQCDPYICDEVLLEEDDMQFY